MNQIHKTFVQGSAPFGSLTGWHAWARGAEARHALQVYEWLAGCATPEGTRISMSAIGGGAIQRPVIYRAIEWLERNGFITNPEPTTSRTFSILPVPEVPDLPDGTKTNRGVSSYGINVVAVPNVEGESLPDGLPLLPEELGQSLTPQACRAYLDLCQSAGTNIAWSDLGYADPRTRDSDLARLEDAGLISRRLDIGGIAVCPPPSRAFASYASDSREAWQDACWMAVQARLTSRSSDMDRLLALYDAICIARSLPNALPKHVLRRTARDLTSSNTYEELRPYLVFFMYRPGYFLNLEDIINRFGATLLTFYKNLGAIVAEAKYARDRAADEQWWLYWLTPDLKARFCADIEEARPKPVVPEPERVHDAPPDTPHEAAPPLNTRRERQAVVPGWLNERL